MKNDRLFQLLYLLLNRQTMTAPELASLLEVSVRTVYRDVEALSMAGIPVLATSGRNGGISLMPGYTFDKALLSDKEQNQILFALQTLGAADQQVETLLAKLGAAFRKANTNWIEVDFSRWGFQHTDHQKFDYLKTALLEKRVIQLTYRGTSGELTKRKIKPVRLIFKEKNWYLQAFCMKAQAFRLFKVSRIAELDLSGDTFSDIFTDLPPLESEFSPPLPTAALKLRIASSLAFRVYDEFAAESIEPQADGSFIVTVDFPMDNWVINYLLSFGTDIQILEPKGLKQQLYSCAKKIAQHYKD